MTKVFGIGMFKTGTTSLGRCLEILGYKTLHGPWWPEDQMIKDPWYREPEKWPQYHDVVKTLVENYDAFQDYPWMFLYKELDQWFPDAKFILTARNPEAVAKSDLGMWRRIGMKNIPAKQQFIDRYQNHFQQVVDYFSEKNNLLIVNFEEGDEWEEICKFLDKPLPDCAFPHLNKSPEDKVKICFPLVEKPGRSYHLLLEGLSGHPRVSLAAPDACDYLLFEFRHFPEFQKLYESNKDKAIIVDYRDDPHSYLVDPKNCRLYLKRSVIDEKGGLVDVVPHISYALMDKFIYSRNPARDIDVGCYFNQGHQKNRNALVQFVSSRNWSNWKTKTGLVTPDGETGRTSYDPIYYYTLRRTKMLVTANPDKWEGDSRLWEGLANGCLVMVDRMQTPIINPLIHEQHLIFYDDFNDLEEKINYYLTHDDERATIAQQGHQFALDHHRSINRIEEILREVGV